ncbi:MAG TPA: CxxxxCH/CxxCH domain-containing protein [Chitinivibrionales bacterium]|nr:CxxxxCH/CxxCH domain-containing protein [Chitinivibrionales bacterium]
MNTLLKIFTAGLLLAALSCTEKGNEPVVSAETCGICHGLPPNDSNHAIYYSGGPRKQQCSICHMGYSADSSTGQYSVNSATHMNGKIDGPSIASCTQCHELPPQDEEHLYHVDSLHYKCSYCHAGYSVDPGSGNFGISGQLHLNGVADVIFSAPWNDSGRAAYDAGLKQCSNVYCHGAIPQGTYASIHWNLGDTVHGDCRLCHDLSATAPGIYAKHYGHSRMGLTVNGVKQLGSNVQYCFYCHGDKLEDTLYSVGLKRVDPVHHINGVFEPASCRTCHAWTTWDEYVAANPGVTPY